MNFLSHSCRYLLIRKPLSMGRRLLSIENTVLVKIGMALLFALLIHSPMALQWQPKCKERDPGTGDCLRWVKGNNQVFPSLPFFLKL